MNRTTTARTLASLNAAALCIWAVSSSPPASADERDSIGALQTIGAAVASGAAISVDAQTVVTRRSLLAALVSPSNDVWKPAVSRERARGSEDLYLKRAPSIVVVRTSTGHGTGFSIGSGLIVTNAHVIHSGLSIDVKRQASYVNVHTGELTSDGAMQVSAKPIRAFIAKMDVDKDLAVLRLEPGTSGPPPLQLAPAGPRPGMDCTIIGHPSSGLLWTIRSGQVAGIGRMPDDMIDVAMSRLGLGLDQRGLLETQLKEAAGFRMFLSSAGANPGDSGGPVLNQQGQIIGVTFAIPSDVGERRFTYHIHLDELREFVAAVPQGAQLAVPDPWDLGVRLGLVDFDGDRRPDAIVESGQQSGLKVLFDVDGDSPLPGAGMSAGVLKRLIETRGWDWEVALHLAPDEAHAFYDRDNDGQLDAIMTGDVLTNAAEFEYERGVKGWRVREGKGELVSPRHLQNPALVKRVGDLLRALATQLERKGPLAGMTWEAGRGNPAAR